MRGHDVETETPDPLAGQPTDQYGVPLSVQHSPQTDLPVWQYIHQLATPLPNSKSPDRPHTHICILCSASPPLRPLGKKTFTWRNALMRQRMSTNAVSHLQRVHPDEFVSVADYKQRKRQVLEEKAAAKANEPKKKRAKRTTGPKRRTARAQTDEAQETVEADATPVALVVKTQSSGVATKTPTSARKRAVGKTVELLKSWLVSSGLPVSMLQDETFQQLMKLSTSAKVAMPSASNLNVQVQDEFAKFGGFLRSYLAAESQAAMGLPFLTLRREFRPISAATAEDGAGVDVDVEKAFLSVAVGFVDSQWRRVDLVLAAKEVPRGWDQQIGQLVTRTVSETYNIDSISNYARFHAEADEDTPSNLAASGEYEPFTDEQEDLLTRTLRRCVIEALGVGRDTSFGGETAVRRVLRLLQELAKYFDTPDRAVALVEISAAHNLQTPLCSASSIDELALSTYTSIGALAELLRVSCTRYHAYSLYFQSPTRPTAAEPELETAWMQFSMDDWHTAAEIEAALNQLAQFRLEERLAPRQGAVAPSYALLFRRLLGVTTQATSLKCLSLEDGSSSSANRAGRRKTKRVDTFTPAGQQCIMRLRELITQRLPAPSTPSAVDDEIKAMLLDPRISSKAANLVTDTRAFRRAQEALRQEHRVVFELIAGRSPDVTANAEEEDEDEDEDDDEISALLMVDGPKNQPPAARSPPNNGRRSGSAVAEDEERAWREWQQVYVAWDTHATEGADLFDKGQYNLLKLYHHVNILKWFRDVGQQAYPAASLLARMYLGRQPGPSRALGASLLRFTEQEDADWVSDAVQRAEKRCILHHNCHRESMDDSEPELQVPQETWVAPPPDVEWHESWDDFTEYFTQYQEQTHQIFRQRTSTSVLKRNREITSRAARGGGCLQVDENTEGTDRNEVQSDRLIPEAFKNFWVKFVCTHGWSRKSRGKGIRKSYFEKSTGCKANVKACVCWKEGEGVNGFMVRVTGFDVSHNHNVSKEIYENHASIRRVDDPAVLSFVDELQAAGSKPKLIMQFVRKKTGKNVALRDIHNMLGVDDDVPEATHPFLKYFMRNWNAMKERWALYARLDIPHLGNHTNNRLESSWGHIKDILKSDMALDECVDTLMFLQAVAEMEYAKKITGVGQMRYDGADDELEKLACEVSSYAYRLVERQYWIARDRKTHYNMYTIHSTMSVLTSEGDHTVSYHVDSSKYRCLCVFMRTMLLPCRHVMCWRLMQGKTAIPVRHIASRWRLSCKLNQPAEEEDVPEKEIACTKFQVHESAM
ncbi:hypothetical protein PF002_g14966 [Phytophthora fragariae]|uniref:SWIM-type domain-containing protein n=1 Tax=Phytophthora fragariae TaxID=53985 RepID=A0A6A3YTV6_9STRA|nr:hypothetical protein PF002_g14966 [Phytophthora fragariae]